MRVQCAGRAAEARQRALEAMCRLVKQLDDAGDREAATQVGMAMLVFRRSWS